MDKSKRKIDTLAKNDKKINCNLIYIDGIEKNHVEKRKAQRAITHEMLKIAIIYGKSFHSHGAKKHIITDRCLLNTIYEPYIDKLRGLSVVSLKQNDSLYAIVTTYWDIKIRSKKFNYAFNNNRSRI